MKNTKKKVLFVATVDSHIELFHLPYLKMFKDKGYEVHVATNTDKKIQYCDKKHKISIERNPFKLNNLKAIRELKKIVNAEKFDIIHCHTPMGGVVARLAAKKARKNGTRMIYTAHGFHFFTGAPLKNWLLFYPVEKYLAKYTDTLVTINKEDFERAKKKFGKRCKDIQYVPGVGVDEKKFSKKLTAKQKHELRKSLGLKDDDFVMIFPAEISDRKNQQWLVNALSPVLKKYSHYHVLLPGSGNIGSGCQRLVRELNLEKQVHLLGFRTDVSNLLQISNLSLSSAKQEGLPVNLIEAGIVGLPIVATDCRGNRDIVGTAKTEKEFLKKIEKRNFEKADVSEYLFSKISKRMERIYFRKKILHLLSSNIYSGAENVACTIIKNYGDFADFYYCSPDGIISDALKKRKIDFSPIDKLNYRNVKKVVDEINPDIIHAHDFRASILASKFSKNRLIISQLHKNDPGMRRVTVKSIIFRIASRRIHKIIVVSKTILKESLFNKYYAKKMIVIPNYVDREQIVKKSKEFEVKENFDFFFFGRLSSEKNPLAFIEIIKRLNNDKIKAIMIGNGSLKYECKHLIKQYGLEKNIEMIGFVENPFPYIKASKIGIMPSRFEGFGLAAIESTILGKPVVNSGVGGLAEIFNNTGLITNNIDGCLKIINSKKFSLPKIDKYTNKKTWCNSIMEIYDEHGD